MTCSKSFSGTLKVSTGRTILSGSGLGLYLCRRLVEAHGGEISAATSVEGQGTTFIVSLPCQSTERL
jgi:signal transduction histidine kinase